MTTAQEMYQYCIQNNFGTGWNEKWALKHFAIIERALQKGETVKMCFIGLHNYHSSTHHSKNFAYAITNNRLIFAQQGLFLGQTMQSISLKMINDITYSSNVNTDYFGVISFKTINTSFNVACGRESGKNILTKINEVIDNSRMENVSTKQSNADELLKYKTLLDIGAITQDEFEKKKRQLLNI